ncbi:MAG: hypothetical protein Q9182_003817 [Xanthomendoza sp. 2 TL-2023]
MAPQRPSSFGDPKFRATWNTNPLPNKTWEVQGYYDRFTWHDLRAIFILSVDDEDDQLRMDLNFNDPHDFFKYEGTLYQEPKGKITHLLYPYSSPKSDSPHSFTIKGECALAGRGGNNILYKGFFRIQEGSGEGKYRGISGGGELSVASKPLECVHEVSQGKGSCVFENMNHIGHKLEGKLSSDGKAMLIEYPSRSSL